MTRRLIPFFLAVLIICAFGATAALAAPENATAITQLNTPMTATIVANSQTYFSYTPASTGVYAFYSSSSEDTYGYLYDSAMSELTHNDDGGEDNNFRIVYELTAGQTYYFGVRYYSEDNEGSFDVCLTKPSLTAQATSDTWITTNRPNETVTMSVSASTDEGSLTFVWTGPDDQAITSGVTGTATTSTLTLSVPAEIGSKTYDCTVSNAAGETKTIDFEVRYGNDLKVEGDDSRELYLSPDVSPRLTVNATCYLGSLSYEWYRLSDTNEKVATGAAFTAPPIGNERTVYECVIRDEYGNSGIVDFFLEPDNGFYIRQHSQTMTVAPGARVTLRADAYTDAGQLTRVWAFEDLTGADGGVSEIPGATGASYTTPAITGRCLYTCTVTNQNGETREVQYEILVNNGLTVAHDRWEDVDCAYGGSVTLTADASCTRGDLHYDWYTEDDVEWPDQASITLTNVTRNRHIELTVTDDYGNSRHVGWYVWIDSNMQIYMITPAYQEVGLGDEATMALEALCDYGQISYRWRGEHWSWIAGATSYTYTIPAVTQTRTYVCEISDGLGNTCERMFVVSPTAPTALQLNTPVSYTAGEASNTRGFSFVPASTGKYTFSSTGNADPYVSLYDSSWVEIDQNDDGGQGYNFKLTAQLTKGQTYYYLISHYDSGNVTVTMESGDGTSLDTPYYGHREYNITLRVGQTMRFAPQFHTTAIEDWMLPTAGVLTHTGSGSGAAFTASKAGTADVYVLSVDEWEEEDFWSVWHVTVVSGAKVIKAPAGLTTLGAEAFAGDTAARFIDLGSGVTTVQASAFASSGAEQINIAGANTRLMGGSLYGTGAVILCPEGSAAEAYCRQYGYTFAYNN